MRSLLSELLSKLIRRLKKVRYRLLSGSHILEKQKIYSRLTEDLCVQAAKHPSTQTPKHPSKSYTVIGQSELLISLARDRSSLAWMDGWMGG